jgi:hypothetical protein
LPASSRLARSQPITGGSAFNIRAQSLRLGVRPGRGGVPLQGAQPGVPERFTPEASALVWELADGQPWLVNALAYETTWEMKAGRDRSQPITG